MSIDEWKERIEMERRQKNLFFASYPQSPLPLEDRVAFEGLAYWPPDPEHRFEVELHRHNEKEMINVEDTGGHQRQMWRWGEFRFQLEGQECALQAYKNNPDEQRLFVPFRDKTSGKETYGAGRYLDLEYERDRSPDGKWIVDFNQAYNPWCAYSNDYVCPFVPPENWLKVAIEAGEKSYRHPGKNHTDHEGLQW